MTEPRQPLLDVDDLSVVFDLEHGTVRAVDGVGFRISDGESIGVVGESGSGKSVTSLAIMGLLAHPPARIDRGTIRYRGEDLTAASPARRRELSGSELAMIYQNASAALNPSLRIGRQITQVVRRHERLGRRAAWDRAAELLAKVGIPDHRARLSDYPHQFSGGQRQRLLIAMALSCNPSILIADEPTTALDVTVQSQIVDLVMNLRAELGMAVIWVSHDLGVIAEVADRAAVMYAGRVVETAPVADLFARPAHPYTRGLIGSLPRPDGTGHRLAPIPGVPPPLTAERTYCAFAARCDLVTDRCRTDAPALTPISIGHESACFRASEVSR